MRGGRAEALLPRDLTSFAREGKRFIRADVDLKFRRALMEAVAQDGGQKARRYIRQALENGPSRGGVNETLQYFGAELWTKLTLTAQIVDGIEISVSGFKKWLQLTGFGNDKTMVKGFVAWAEHKEGKGRVITGVKQAFDA